MVAVFIYGGELQMPVEVESPVITALSEDDLLLGRLLAVDDAVLIQIAFPSRQQAIRSPS